ncbi:PE-PPE domain-containing protein, partial [Mycobacterium sp.]|uniref:PE-PPE domain-containing protein n=1 Tax=Mycobacterium sp. TaxID=1785 RepID=UPI002D00075D
VHGQYASIDPSTLPSNELVLLPGSTGVPSPSGEAMNTSYYMITPPGLPLVAPLRAIPLIGNPLADLVQPDLTTLVNLGYGNPNYGYSAFPGDNVGANVQTTFGVFHPVNASLVANDLVTGAQQGANAFVSDLSSLSLASVQSGMSHTLTSMAGTGHTLTAGLASALASPASFTDSLQTLIANSGNAITSAGASLTEIIQPTIDVANALVTTMPIYDVNLFLQGIGQAAGGDVVDGLVNAFLLPLAADTALLTLAGGFELVIVMNGVGGAVSAIGGLV